MRIKKNIMAGSYPATFFFTYIVDNNKIFCNTFLQKKTPVITLESGVPLSTGTL